MLARTGRAREAQEGLASSRLDSISSIRPSMDAQYYSIYPCSLTPVVTALFRAYPSRFHPGQAHQIAHQRPTPGTSSVDCHLPPPHQSHCLFVSSKSASRQFSTLFLALPTSNANSYHQKKSHYYAHIRADLRTITPADCTPFRHSFARLQHS